MGYRFSPIYVLRLLVFDFCLFSSFKFFNFPILIGCDRGRETIRRVLRTSICTAAKEQGHPRRREQGCCACRHHQLYGSTQISYHLYTGYSSCVTFSSLHGGIQIGIPSVFLVSDLFEEICKACLTPPFSLSASDTAGVL